MTLDELTSLIKTRRSIRKWQDKPVPEELLKQAIELATWAPNAGNQQSWRFYVILNRNTIKQIGDAVQALVDKTASWPEAAKYGEDTTRWQRTAAFFRNAPAVIVVAAGKYVGVADRILEARATVDAEAVKIRQWRAISASRIQTVGAAIGYLLLILHQMGLGTTYMSGPMQAKGEIEKILKVPADLDVVALVPVGYPAESPTKTRKPISEVCEIMR